MKPKSTATKGPATASRRTRRSRFIADRDCKRLKEPATVAIQQRLAQYPKIDLL
jgi:hypothetical protein